MGRSASAVEPITDRGGDNRYGSHSCEQLLLVTFYEDDREDGVGTVFERRGLPRRFLQIWRGERAGCRGAARIGVALQARQIRSQISGGLISKGTVFLERLADDAFEFGGDVRIDPGRRGRSARQDRFKDDSGSFTTKGDCTGCHLVQDRAKGEQIRASIKFFSFGLLWGHVDDGAKRGAWAGQMHVVQSGTGDGAGSMAR